MNHIITMHALNGYQQFPSIEFRTVQRQLPELCDMLQQVAISSECECKKELAGRLKGTEEGDDAFFILQPQQCRLFTYDVLLLLLPRYMCLVADFYYKKESMTKMKLEQNAQKHEKKNRFVTYIRVPHTHSTHSFSIHS